MRRPIAALIAFVLLALTACGGTTESAPGVGGSTKRDAVASNELQFRPPAQDAVVAIMETTLGTIRIVLYPELAPLAVENFCQLARNSYYNSTNFHRVVKDFVIQGGDGSGTGLSGESIWGHPYTTEFSDLLHHYTGSLCTASADSVPGTNLSQFYIVATPQDNITEEAAALMQEAGLRQEVMDAYRQAGGAPYLDTTDTVFGQVYAGMDVVDTIARVAVDENSLPKEPVVLLKVTITTYSTAAGSVPTSSTPASAAPLNNSTTGAA